MAEPRSLWKQSRGSLGWKPGRRAGRGPFYPHAPPPFFFFSSDPGRDARPVSGAGFWPSSPAQASQPGPAARASLGRARRLGHKMAARPQRLARCEASSRAFCPHRAEPRRVFRLTLPPPFFVCFVLFEHLLFLKIKHGGQVGQGRFLKTRST